MPARASFPRLFSPVRLGPREARNRVMRLPTNSGMAERNRPSEAMTAYHVDLARGGVGTIVTEAFAVHAASTRSDRLVALFDRDAVSALARFAAAVQDEGALLIAQMVHGGRQHHATRGVPTVWGPSAIACSYSGGVPHPMSRDDIEEVIEGFVQSAVNARDAGFAGVEIHGAQGFLIQQFASPLSNQRDDEYGGPLENRMRFGLEVIRRVRAIVGPDMIVGYRLGLDEYVPGGLSAEDGRRIGAMVAATGAIDYLSLSQGNFASIEMHLPDRHFAPAAFTDLHASIRPHVGDMPLVTSGKIGKPEQAEAILASGQADLIGLSRALTADPAWPAKAQRGDTRAIRPCIACNECWAAITNGERLRCVVNPALGLEPPLQASRTGTTTRIVVVGGGPAGLEAARVAAKDGAQVSLWETRETLGGKLRDTAALPHQAEFGWLADYLAEQAVQAGVAIRTGTAATVESILAEEPDAVVVATGATGVVPRLPSDGSVPCSAEVAVELPSADPSRTVVIYDAEGYNWGGAVAEHVAGLGHPVTLVTRFFEPLRSLPTVTRIATLRELDRLGVTWRANREPVRIERGAVILRDRLSGREERIEAGLALIFAGSQQPADELGLALRDRGIRLAVIGDAFAPRRISDALADARSAVDRMLQGKPAPKAAVRA